MRRPEIDILLEAIDTAANSNSYWLSFGIASDGFDLERFIIAQLKTGNFHFELVKEDLERGLNGYSEMIFPKNADSPTFLPRPGNVWNGKESISFDALTDKQIKDLLIDLIGEQKDFFSKSHLGKQYDCKTAERIVKGFIDSLNQNGAWQAFKLTPDFLNQEDDYYNTDYIQQGYFENNDRDLALAIKFESDLCILLANGYG
jgi:hypothetical protein